MIRIGAFLELTKQTNARGIILMIISMGAFALADTLVKVSSTMMSPAQVLLVLVAGSMLMFASMAKVRGESLSDPRAFAPVLLLRYFSEVIGMVGMVMALTYVPLSIVGAITQATPILVAIGAVIFLGEKVSWRRWSAIALGFVGVWLIIQPGSEGVDAAIFWAVLAMVALSIRDLSTRLIPPGMPSTSLAAYTMVAAVPFAVGWVVYNGESLIPDQSSWVVIVPMVVLGSLGYVLLIVSIRMAEISVVTPFRYTRILFLLVLGIIVFEERPTTTMLCGATLIVITGIYMMWREQRVKTSQS